MMRNLWKIACSALACVILALFASLGGAAAGSDSEYLFDGEGTYYVTGVKLGVNLTFGEGSLVLRLSDGRLSEKKDCTRFRFERRGANCYSIHPDCATDVYLTYGYAEQLTAERNTGTIPASGLWRVLPGPGGARIVNVANGHQLVTYGLEPALRSQEEAEQIADGDTSLWLLVRTTCYGTGETSAVRELSVAEKEIEKAVTKSATVPFCELFGFSWGPFSRPGDFTFSLDRTDVMSVSSTGVIKVNGAGEATFSARHRYTGQRLTATLRVSNDVIVIVPGFMGSELKNKSGDKIWCESLLDQLSNGVNLSALSKFMDLGSPSSGDGITAYNNSFGALNLYRKMYQMLVTKFGKDYTVEFYAYDWRKSSGTTGRELARYLDGKNYDNVIFVTHSFGGLVCGQALASSEKLREHTALMCMVGVPVNGTAGLAQAWAQDKFGNVLGLGSFGSMENSAIRKIVCTLPSVYEMLPSAYGVEQLGAVGNCTSYSQFTSACAESCTSFNRSLASDAAKVTAKLYIDGRSVFDMVPTAVFGGTGYDTATSAKVSGGKLSFGNTTDGDGIATRDECRAGIGGDEPPEVAGAPSRHLWLCEDQAVVDGVAEAIRGLAE